MEAILQPGQIVPSFTLPDAQGRPVRRNDYRGKRHVALVFLPSGADYGAWAYLRALTASYAAFAAAGSEVLAVLREDTTAAWGVSKPPFPILIDANGKTAARFLPIPARAGIFVTDRYGELYFSALTAGADTLPPVADLLAWMEAIDNQCTC